MARTREIWAACLCGGMGLLVVAVLAWEQHRVARGLRADLDRLTRVVAAGGPVSSRVDPDDTSDEAEVLREWSRRDRQDNPWPDVASRRDSFDRQPSEGGMR